MKTPGPGADSYGETFGPDEVDDGSGGTNKAGSNGADSLAERLQVPELYEKSIQSEDGTFQLTCNAETVVPDVSQIPIYKVRPKEIDGEWIDCITEAFFGSYPVYDGASYLPDPEIYGSDVENPMKKRKYIHGWRIRTIYRKRQNIIATISTVSWKWKKIFSAISWNGQPTTVWRLK